MKWHVRSQVLKFLTFQGSWQTVHQIMPKWMGFSLSKGTQLVDLLSQDVTVNSKPFCQFEGGLNVEKASMDKILVMKKFVLSSASRDRFWSWIWCPVGSLPQVGNYDRCRRRWGSSIPLLLTLIYRCASVLEAGYVTLHNLQFMGLRLVLRLKYIQLVPIKEDKLRSALEKYNYWDVQNLRYNVIKVWSGWPPTLEEATMDPENRLSFYVFLWMMLRSR